MSGRGDSLGRLIDMGRDRSEEQDLLAFSLLSSTPVVFRSLPELQDPSGNRYLQADLDATDPAEQPCLLGDVADYLVASGAGVVVSSRPGSSGRFMLNVGALDCLRHHGSFEAPCDVGVVQFARGGAAIRVEAGQRLQFVQPLRGFLRPDLARTLDVRLACSGWLAPQREMAIMRLPSHGLRQAMVFRRPWEGFADADSRSEALDVLSWHLFPGAVVCLLPQSVLDLSVGFTPLAELARAG